MKLDDKTISEILIFYTLTRDLYYLSGKEFRMKELENYLEDAMINTLLRKNIEMTDFPLEKLILKSWVIYQEIKESRYKFNDDTKLHIKDILDDLQLPFENISIDSSGFNFKNTIAGKNYLNIFEEFVSKFDNFDDDNLNIVKSHIQEEINSKNKEKDLEKLKEEFEECIRKEEYEKAGEISKKINNFK